MEKKIINDAIELVKNIPPTDETSLERNLETKQPRISNDLLGEYPISVTEEYDVVVDSTLDKFIQSVNERLKDWWSINWWFNVVTTSNWTKFYQSMIRWDEKYEDEEKIQPLNMPGLENEPDLYEDVEKDANEW